MFWLGLQPGTGISFEQSSYKVLEDVGVENLALCVCIDINVGLMLVERTVRLRTLSGTAQGEYILDAMLSRKCMVYNRCL